MKTLALLLALLVPVLVTAGPAQAACYADYKAKQDGPLRLHYGVAEIRGACTVQAAKADLAPRLDSQGWTLLSVVSVFDETGLNKRKASAGQYFLRF
ncbi:hypothetical protein [Puniceibacterium sediminis]|uniref:DUF4177 domain-containing protein n=1 Tax=Puniceibacterium sediminis TaxID=1608407 RepID=A0A238WPQ1_9RHOB|nr:hypothetical protein [Puniceibacterium sediminis]SNR48361.1 hypothetical protein SAMN06265370_106214 [Puniceibacterium sediminis]